MSAQSRVLFYFLVCFFVAALALVGHTWWRKAQACNVQCTATGSAGGAIGFSGGGRFGIGTVCTCGASSAAK